MTAAVSATSAKLPPGDEVASRAQFDDEALGDAAAKAARAGGWHESSYELKHGLEITESEWPDEVTVPGALGDS